MPTTKKMLNLSLKKTRHCGENILDAAPVDDYVGKLTPSATNVQLLIHSKIRFGLTFSVAA
jgi:hypothetical protein